MGCLEGSGVPVLYIGRTVPNMQAAAPPETPEQMFTVQHYYHKEAVVLTINVVIT